MNKYSKFFYSVKVISLSEGTEVPLEKFNLSPDWTWVIYKTVHVYFLPFLSQVNQSVFVIFSGGSWGRERGGEPHPAVLRGNSWLCTQDLLLKVPREPYVVLGIEAGQPRARQTPSRLTISLTPSLSSLLKDTVNSEWVSALPVIERKCYEEIVSLLSVPAVPFVVCGVQRQRSQQACRGGDG